MFAKPVPAELAKALKKPGGSWTQMFGAQADRAFNTWHTARFVDEIAAAGKAIKPLPMYVNASLAGPSNVPDPTGVASGGPQQDVLDIWKAAAPALDFQAPDIYDRDAAHVAIHGQDVCVSGGSEVHRDCLLYTSPSPRDVEESRMPSSA